MAKIIKISQGGKTLSFFLAVAIALCAAASAFADGLPEGYTQLPYIKAIANVQLKTGYTPSPTDKIVMTWRPAQTNSQETLWCARQSTSSPKKAFFAYMYSGKIRIIFDDYTSPVQSDANFTVNKCDPVAPYAKYTAIADGNAKTFTVTNDFTGAEVLNVSWTFSASSEVGSQLCLFASHNSSAATANASWSSHILYSFKVYDAVGALKLDLVPAKNSSGTVGLYDTVGGNFLTKSTSTGSLSDTLTFDDNYTLVDDEVLGKISVASGKTLNLNGHSLTVSGIAGSGTITGTMVDITAPDPSAERVTSDPSDLGDYHAKVLFNNNFSRGSDVDHRLLVAASKLPLKVDYDLGEGKPLNAYKIYFEATSGNYVNRAPKEWKFYGSNDKDNWTCLDERMSETGWGTKENRTYPFTNSTPYRYYRIEFIEQNGKDGSNYEFLELIQLEYFYLEDELHLHVPAGVTNSNSTVSFNGSIKLVKEGEGAFIAAKTGQQYAGGTDILGGTVRLVAGAQGQLLGALSSRVSVASGATLDVCDNTQVYGYKVVSAGGTLTNSGSGLANNVGQIGSLTLTDDSVLDSTHSLGLMKADYSTTSLDLGGHTLDVQILGGGIFRISNCDATNGTVRVTTTGSGDISFINGETRASTVDFDLSCNVKPYANATVRSLLLRERCSTVKDTLTLSVLGCFRTETDDFPNVRLEDGATLDLSGREGVLSTAGSSAHEDHYYLTFADGATIKVSIGSRQGFGSSETKVVDWTGNQPAANVNFTCADGEHFGLRKKSDGLYIYKKGFIMTVM